MKEKLGGLPIPVIKLNLADCTALPFHLCERKSRIRERRYAQCFSTNWKKKNISKSGLWENLKRILKYNILRRKKRIPLYEKKKK